MLRVGKDRQKQKPKKKKKKKKNQGQIASNRVREKTTIEYINLHDTWTEWTNEACSNAVKKLFNYTYKPTIDLNIEF